MSALISSDDSSDKEALYAVNMSRDALAVYMRLPDGKVADRVDEVIDLLARFPYLGHVYDSVYEAACPPFDLRVIHAGYYGVYYEVSEEACTVSIAFIEDDRRDPMRRFGDVEELG